MPTRGPRPERDAWGGLRGYLARGSHRVVGLMTGTSADAVDAALVRFEGSGPGTTHELEAYRETPLDDALRAGILEVAGSETVALERLMELDAELGQIGRAHV